MRRDSHQSRTFQLTLAQIAQSTDPVTRPATMVVCGETFALHRGVVSPVAFPSTEIFASKLPYPIGGSFLEMGCGAGVAAVLGAERGCSRVVAIDISGAAVANTAENARLHHVEAIVSVLEGDLYSPLDARDRFDLIFWNSSFVFTPAAYQFRDVHERGFFDPGYDAHARYIRGAAAHLNPGGSLLLGFSDLGTLPLLRRLCRHYGYRPVVTYEQTAEEQTSVQYQLLALHPSLGASVSPITSATSSNLAISPSSDIPEAGVSS